MPKFREITGQFVGYIPDGIDPDVVPDRAPMNGRVTFTPVFTGGVIAFPELSPPEFARPEPISALIVDGFVRVAVGVDDGVTLQPLTLMVTVDDEATQTWSWRADFSDIAFGSDGNSVAIPAWSFRVPDGTGPVDLTELVPLKTSGSVDVTKGPRGAGLENITAVDGQLVFEYTDGEETTVPIPEAVQGPEGPQGPAGADGPEGPQGEKGDPGEIPDLLVGNITDATPTGKNLMLAATEGAARNALGLQTGATSIAGSLEELNNGTQTNSRVWSPKNISDYVESQKAVISGAGNPNGTVPVSGGKTYVDTNTGKRYVGVDRGPGPVTNMATNPSFENSAPVFSEEYLEGAGVNSSFNVASINLRYSYMDDTSQPAYTLWPNRKPKIAAYLQDKQVKIAGFQENYVSSPKTQLEELFELLPSNFGKVEVVSSNGGIIYDKNVFSLEYELKDYYPINIQEATSGMERNLTVAMFRHLQTDQRLIYGVVHFTQGAEHENKRRESVRRVGEWLNTFRNSLSDNPAIILSGDFNKIGGYATEEDPMYLALAEHGLAPTRTKSQSVKNTDYGSFNGFNVNGSTTGNWIDDNYSNSMLEVIESGPDVFFADGSTVPLDPEKFLSDHHPLLSEFQFKYNVAVSSINATTAMTTGGGALAYYSTRWSATGQGSLAIKATGSTSGCAYPAGLATGTDRIRWEFGKTYTVSATIHLEEAQTAPAGWARSFTIGTTKNGTHTYGTFAAVRAANAAGTTRLSVSFTIPTDVTNCFIRLMNGSTNQTVYWDNLMITEGSTEHEYFDGDTLGCYWTGARHGSTSVYPGPSWVEI